MIRNNLATRPFYNERVVRRWLALAAVLVAGATVLNVSRVVHYQRDDTERKAQAARDEERAGELRDEAGRLRASVDPSHMEMISVETQQANDLIGRRAFSWTELFNRFETTLPPNARITSVRPSVAEGRGIRLEIMVVARDVDDVDEFMKSLESSGAFVDALSRDERINEQGQLEAAIETTYAPPTIAPGQSGPAG